MKSLDPRVNRLPEVGQGGVFTSAGPGDQFATFEVFVQPREGKPFQHEGAVHAPNLEMAFVLAKETFTRRFTCVSLAVTATREVTVSPISEGGVNAYDLIDDAPLSDPAGQKLRYEIYHLPKRGKQQIQAGTVDAISGAEALTVAKRLFSTQKNVQAVWAIPVDRMLSAGPAEKDLWATLPEKKFRDAAEYKGGDKLKTFLSRNPS
jgi:ring-1,2-phenylacetyl-CoA epoxidase subunit PaaB